MSVTMPTLIFFSGSAVAVASACRRRPFSSSSPHAATDPMHIATTAMSRRRIHFVVTERNPPLVMCSTHSRIAPA